MGSSSKTTNSTQNTTQSQSGSQAQVSSPLAPSYVTSPLQQSLASISALSGTNPQSYVAPASGNQNSAYALGGSTLGSVSPSFGNAASLASGNANVGAGQIAQFMSPYTQNVVGATKALYDQQNAQSLAQDEAAGAANGAFGGSRFGVEQGQLQAQNELNENNAISGLLNSGYQSAVGNALTNAGLGQTASANLTAAGSASDASNRANLSTLDALGQDQRSIAQAQATAPISLAQAVEALLSGSGVNASDVVGQGVAGQSAANGQSNTTGTSTTTSNPGILGSLTSLGGLLTGIPDDVGGVTSLASLFA